MDIFEKFLMEAEGDTPDTMGDDMIPPDISDDMNIDEPPSLDDGSDDTSFTDPPTLDDSDGSDEFGSIDEEPEGNQEEEQQLMADADTDGDNNIGLDDKVSAVMNVSLHQRYLSLLTNISQELSSIRNNNDIIYTLSDDSIKIVDSLNRLDENIRLYLKNSFQHENYSKNLLFFNKCLNLLKLLNDSFNSSIKKGMHSMN